MSGKGRRVASRQAQLGRRRRRQNRGAGGAPSTEPQQGEATQDETSQSVATKVREPVPSSNSAATPASAPSRPPSAAVQTRPSRARSERPLAYNYVGPELRRILILGGVLTAALVAASFFI